jgi:putative ABC transport system ATP-binding protein
VNRGDHRTSRHAKVASVDWKLEARALSRRKAAGDWLIRDTSVLIRPGDRIGLHGESGAGKTVFLRALAALDPLDSGSLWWSGDEVRGAEMPRYRSRVVILPQRPALVEGSVEQNLALPFELRVHRGKRFEREQALPLLESLGRSSSFLAKNHGDLSGGEAQIACLVRALLIAPAVLLLDEPTASLDAKSAQRVERALRAWLEEAPTARALVCVSHDLALLDTLTERRLRIHGGTLTEDA